MRLGATMEHVVERVVKEFKTEMDKNGERKWILRIVTYNDSRPQLEKRKFEKEDGNWTQKGRVGLRATDLRIIQENMAQIMEILGQKG